MHPSNRYTCSSPCPSYHVCPQIEERVDADVLQHPHPASPSRPRYPSNPTARPSIMHLHEPQAIDPGLHLNSFYIPPHIPESTTPAVRKKKAAATVSSNTMSASTTLKRASSKSCKHGSWSSGEACVRTAQRLLKIQEVTTPRIQLPK